jgi:hypothetical protein
MNRVRTTNMQKRFRDTVTDLYDAQPQPGLSDRVSLRIEKYERKRALVGIISSVGASVTSFVIAITAVSSVISTLRFAGFFEYMDASVMSDALSSGALMDVLSIVVESVPGYMFAGFILSTALLVGSVIGAIGFTRARLSLR